MASNDSGGAAPADYVAMLLSPLLIMALVGSLVFFLLEILYAGEHLGNMQWILFFFVFAAVLIARISLTPEIAARAPVYMGIIGLLGWAAFIRFVEFPEHLKGSAPLISLGIVVLVLWCAHRLTWDCTWMDDSSGVSCEGILQATGLDEKPEPSTSVERYKQKQKDEEGKRRSPGTWVVYFSLAALPIFGLGQALIPAEELGRRRFTFWLMIVYVGSGLGLLLTTTFLGLRQYLRRRRLRMPLTMTACWLTLGGVFIVGLLMGGTLMPRPNAEVALLDLNGARSKQRDASRKNFKKDKPGEGEGDPSGGQPGQKDRQPDNNKDRDARSTDRQSDKDQPQKDGQKDRSDRQNGKDRQTGQEKKDQPGGKDEAEQERKDKGEQGDKQEQSSAESQSREDRPNVSLEKLMAVLKWVVFAVLALIVLFVVLRALLQFAAGFSSWARNLLDFFHRFWASLLGLFGGQQTAKQQSEEEAELERLARLPFAAFGNPFEDGRAARMSTAALTRYIFAALEAWTRERNLGRQPGETALEFTDRLGGEVLPLERELRRLGQLYSLVVYGRGGAPANTRELLQRFWEALERATTRPLSA